jgi:serine/threonine protein kinase
MIVFASDVASLAVTGFHAHIYCVTISLSLHPQIRLLRVLSHQNIIKLLDILTPPDINNFDELCLVFEFVDTDLEKLFKSRQYFQLLHVQYMVYQILLGLRFCHSAHGTAV